jgi:hypothetical protein
MADWLLKFLGIKADPGATLTHPELSLRGTVPPAVVILIFLVLAALALLLYFREEGEDVGWFRRWTMAVLRIALLALLCLVLLRPVLSFTMENSVRRSLVVLVDSSKSMAIKDPRAEPADLKRAAIGLDLINPTGGLNQTLSPEQASKAASISRADLLKAVMKNPRIGLLEKLSKEYDLKVYAFQDSPDGRGVLPTVATAPTTQGTASFFDRLQPWSPVTPLGDELRKAINRTRGQPIAGVVLLTDGGSNAGSDPVMAAKLARDEGVPVYSYGVGISSPKDIVVAEVMTPNDIVFARDEVPVSVRVRARNLAGESAKLTLTLGGKVVDTKTVDLSQDEQLVAMKMIPPAKGMYDLVASIDPRPDEADQGNNSKQRRLQVIDDKIKVLLVDQTPRWEFKYLMQQMLRDRRVDLKVYLVDGDPGLTAGPDSPYLTEFPKSKADLTDKFDVILFGDVNPNVLSAAQMANINDFVAKQGGGFIMIAGRQFSPNAYANTPIEKLLPVELESVRSYVSSGPNADVFDKPIKVDLTTAGARNGMLRLSDKEEETVRKWKDLPPIYWDARVARIKPAAQALLVDADPAKAIRGEKMPIIALQQYQLGQVLFVGTDNTWRWRRNKGDEFYITLWGQMIQRTALNHLLGSKRTRIEKEKDQYAVGEQVTFYAHVYDTTYSPVLDETIKAYYVPADANSASGGEHEVTMRRVADQPGMYKGQFTAVSPGNYQFYVDRPGDPTKRENFSIVESTAEFGDTAMNEPLLKQIAQITGGQFFREEDLYKLPDAVKLKTDKVGWPVEIELWSTKLFFLFALAFVTAEWILRKTAQLK